uniref:Exocyst complex component sec3 n=1 Tax=Rhizophora mucronata TaxID=61149 RepID=A0A2P2MS96_RHIMU
MTLPTTSTWKPEDLSSLSQTGWSRWGISLKPVVQNFHTCPKIPSCIYPTKKVTIPLKSNSYVVSCTLHQWTCQPEAEKLIATHSLENNEDTILRVCVG